MQFLCSLLARAAAIVEFIVAQKRQTNSEQQIRPASASQPIHQKHSFLSRIHTADRCVLAGRGLLQAQV
jgi:hypothetical protein